MGHITITPATQLPTGAGGHRPLPSALGVFAYTARYGLDDRTPDGTYLQRQRQAERDVLRRARRDGRTVPMLTEHGPGRVTIYARPR